MKTLLVIIFLAIMSVGIAHASDDDAESTYRGLRSLIFSQLPTENSDVNQSTPDVIGVMMETGYSQAVVTFVATSDNAVSLYYSSGGGIIGSGEHESVKKPASELLKSTPQYLNQMQPTKTYPLPDEGITHFYIITSAGVFTLSAKESDLGNNLHAMSPYFHQAHKVIYQISQIYAD